MTVITLGEAEQKFAESVDYYESDEAGLGARFRDEVTEAVQRIENNPELPRLRPKGYRRVNLRAFPH
jgi:ParE toxin of type II toxin-antitoxin system, parDE